MKHDKPSLAIIIPNYNGSAHLEYCLPSLSESAANATGISTTITVVDNGSVDESLPMMSDKFPAVVVLRNERNLGYAEGANVGIRWALEHKYDYVVVSNNDIRVLPWWIEATVQEFQTNETVGIIGYRELGRGQIEALKWPATVEYRKIADDPSGCFYACRAALFRHIGLFDADYYAYFEEVDLFTRARRAGFDIYEANIPVWHYGSGTSQKMSIRAAWLTHRNAMRFAVKTQNAYAVLRHTGRLFLLSCSPVSVDTLVNYVRNKRVNDGTDVDTERLKQQIRRVRPGNVLLNFSVFVVAVLWNLVHLPHTLYARKRDMSMLTTHVSRKVRS